MRLSESGLALLREFEGFRERAYPDPGSRDGLPVTIGYGSTRYEDGSRIQLGDTITRERADELLRREVAETEAAVAGLVTVPLSQSQFDALVSFAFNVGTGALAKSTLLRLLNGGDYAGASDQLLRWNKNDGAVLEGLTRRRQRERAMFLMAPPVTVGVRPDPRPNDAASSLDLPPAAPQPATPERKMSPLLGPLIGLLTSVAPDLVRIFTDKDKPVAERNTEAAIKVLDIAKKVAESPTPAAAVEAIVADPAKAETFRVAVREQWYELAESGGGGIEGARRTALLITSGGDWRALGYGVTIALLALLIVGGGGFMLWSLIHDPATTPEQRGMLIGALVALIGSPVAYFFGSSVSSRAKDSALVDQLGKR